MDFRVEITGPAIADLGEIVSYIAGDNPAAAAVIGNNLLDADASQGQPLPFYCWSPQADDASVQDLLSGA